MMRHVCTLLGVPFHYGTSEELVGDMLFRLRNNTACDLIFTPNPEILMIGEQDLQYKKILQQVDVSLPDGSGLLFASSFLSKSTGKSWPVVVWNFVVCSAALLLRKKYVSDIIPGVIPGSGTFFLLHDALQHTDLSVFYFGGEHGVEKQIAPVMKRKYPSLHIAGSTGGYPFKNPEEGERILQEIEQARPDMLFIALSFPWQERWAVLHRERLTKAGVKVAMVVGGTFDFAVEKRKRAPELFQKLSLEWLWRLVQEPSRFGRIMTAVVKFPIYILKKRLAGESNLLTRPSSTSRSSA